MRLVHALRRVLSREVEAGELVVKDYETDFDELWGLEAVLHGAVVLVWGDTPAGDAAPVATGPYVSPIHWAIRTADLASRTGARFAITIVDLRPNDREEIPLHALLSETGAKGWPAWIRLVGPAELVVESREELKRRLRPEGSLSDPDDAALRLLMDQVRKHLTDPSERDPRHALANILGPMILLGDVPTQVPPAGIGRAKHREALRQLLALGGLLQEHDDAIETGDDILSDGTRIYLLDDQWNHGWGEWLCTVLRVGFAAPALLQGGPQLVSKSGSKVEVFAARDPGWLLEKLREQPAPFQLKLDPERRPGQEILLLDLRLFAENEGAERAFQKDLRAACRPYQDQQPGFAAEELAAEATDPKSRALLGRLLALKDLSFPVILFSSTSDRSYVREFEHCPNVITSFAKPGRLGQRFDGPQRDTTTPAFLVALREAKALCDARTFVQSLLERPRKALPVCTEPPSHVEIFVDESGEGKFSVGGVALLYPRGFSPDQLNSDLQAEGIVWGLAEKHPPAHADDQVPGEYFPKNPRARVGTWSAYCPYLERIAQFLEDRQIECAAFALTWAPDTAEDWSRVPAPLREDVLDNRYRRMTEEVLEALLYSVLPAKGAFNAEVSIYCGTRVQPVQPPFDRQTIGYRFGISSFTIKGAPFYYVLGQSSVYEVVARVMASRRSAPPNVHRAVGVSLYDYADMAGWDAERRLRVINDTSRPRARQIHYLADWFARFGLSHPSVPSHSLIPTSFKRGFLDVRNQSWSEWLSASRAASEERATDALFHVWQALRADTPSGPWPLERWLRHEAIPDCVRALQGSDFVELAARIRTTSHVGDISGSQEAMAPALGGAHEPLELLASPLVECQSSSQALQEEGAASSLGEPSRGAIARCWRLDGLPVAGTTGFRRDQLEHEILNLGFASAPRRVVNHFFLDISASPSDQAALKAVLAAPATRLCGYDVRFVSAEDGY